MRFFSYESKASQILLKLGQSCWLNVLWLICSLPIFTLGAATAALYTVTLKMVKDREGDIALPFFRAFRDNFKQATILWLILLGAGLLLGADGYILYHLSRTTTGPMAVAWTLMLALIIVAAVACVIVLLYVFPLVASVVNTNAAMLKNSLFIGLRYLFCTICLMAIHFAMFFVAVRFFTPILIFGEGLCALLSSMLLSGVIAACTRDPEEQDAEEAEAVESGDEGEEEDTGGEDEEDTP